MLNQNILFEPIGEEKRKQIEESNISIVGVGSLGTNVIDLLVRTGVKSLTLIDDDLIEKNNLERQSLFNENDIGRSKVETAKEKLEKINSKANIKIYRQRLNRDNIDLIKSDIVLDCTDNLATRFLINDFCVKNKIPWIYSSAIESTGYVLVIYPKKTPCFSCIIKEPTEELDNCNTRGILNTIARAIASIQVTECLKIITKQPFTKELIYYDIWKNKLTKTKVNKNPECQACNNKFTYLETNKQLILQKCSSGGAYIARPTGKQELDLNKIKNNFETVADTPIVLIIKDKFKVSCYKNGKLMIECDNEKEAEIQANKIYSS